MNKNRINKITKEEFLNSDVFYVKRTKVKKPYFILDEFRMRISNNGNPLLLESSMLNFERDRILDMNSLSIKLKEAWYTMLVEEFEKDKMKFLHQQKMEEDRKEEEEIRDAFYKENQIKFNEIVELMKFYLNNPEKVKFKLLYHEENDILLRKNRVKHSNYSSYYHKEREVIICGTDLSELVLKKGKIGRKSVLFFFNDNEWYYLHKSKFEFIEISDQNILRSLKLVRVKSKII